MTNDYKDLYISEAGLHGLMNDNVAWVASCLSDGEHTGWSPSLVALVKESIEDNGTIILHSLQVDFNEHEEKHKIMRAIGKGIYEQKKIPVAVVLSMECWIVRRRKGTVAPYCEPRHDPARQEGINIQGLALGRQRQAYMTHSLIERDKDDKIKIGEFSPIMKAEANLLESFFHGFFETIAKKAWIKMPE